MTTLTTRSPGDLIAVAAIIFGFGLTVFMFRLQREIWVKENRPNWPSWLAWSDYLILGAILLAVCSVTLLLANCLPTQVVLRVTSAACVAAIVLEAGYIPAILAHYRIELGTSRTGNRKKGEPAERWFVCISVMIALSSFIYVVTLYQG